jgi:hypothetical protein
MNVLRELAHAFEETRRLRPCFYLLTGAVGFVGGGVGIAVMYFAGMLLGGALGIDANAPLRNQAGGAAWVTLFLALIPVAIYVGVVTVAGSFAMVMVLLGRFTTNEALRYAFLSRYPRNWLKD